MEDKNGLKESLIYSWNDVNYLGEDTRNLFNRRIVNVETDDETLRDGLQSPSVKMPTIEQKLKILHYINELGINCADIGLPAAGEMVQQDVLRLAQEIVNCKMDVKPACAARTVVGDIEPIVEISQRAGIPIEAQIFIGSSAIRRYAEEWSLSRMLKNTEESVKFCVSNQIPVMYVTEDTTRADPRILKHLYSVAIQNGAQRICVCDTVGYATPDGVINLLDYIKKVVWDAGEDVKIDWHGHNDKGLGLCNTLVAAIDAGVDRIHGTCLGIGERCGNAALDQILINLYLMGYYKRDLHALNDYCHFVANACQVPIPYNYPAIGNDAFRTATGVHAAAIIKAIKKSDDSWLADFVYSGVPAHAIGSEQLIEIGPVSGKSNVVYWLQTMGIKPSEQLEHAKFSDHILSTEEVFEIIKNLE